MRRLLPLLAACTLAAGAAAQSGPVIVGPGSGIKLEKVAVQRAADGR